MSVPQDTMDFLAAHPKSWFTRNQLAEALGLDNPEQLNVAGFSDNQQSHIHKKPDPELPRRFLYRWNSSGKPYQLHQKRQKSVSTNGEMVLGETLKVIGLVQMPGDAGVTVMVLRPDGSVKELALA